MSLLVGIRVIFLIIANILNAINTRVKRGVYQFQLTELKNLLIRIFSGIIRLYGIKEKA